ncbi:MAG: peptide chain release factor-like protein [Phycisphaerae bacterium]
MEIDANPSAPSPIDAARRDAWLAADDDALLADCAIDRYRASGPGGQKRNKTSSAVRLRHRPSGLIVIAEESRSQHENKARALRRLRLALALHVRTPWYASAAPQPLAVEISPRNQAYPALVARLLDALAASSGRVADAAARLGLTTGQLSKLLTRDSKLLAAANALRGAAALPPLRC